MGQSQELRVVTRLSGVAPEVVRIKDLRAGDVFTISEIPGKHVVCCLPFQQENGVWGVSTYPAQ